MGAGSGGSQSLEDQQEGRQGPASLVQALEGRKISGAPVPLRGPSGMSERPSPGASFPDRVTC